MQKKFSTTKHKRYEYISVWRFLGVLRSNEKHFFCYSWTNFSFFDYDFTKRRKRNPKNISFLLMSKLIEKEDVFEKNKINDMMMKQLICNEIIIIFSTIMLIII